jgi:hypothetical protein
LLVAGLIAWTLGPQVFAVPSLDAGMPLTGFLGAVLLWLTPGLAIVAVQQWWEFRRNDPARVQPPLVHLHNATPAALAAIRRWGYDFAFPTRPKPRAAVGLTLVHPEASQATEFQPRWPLAVSLQDLQGEIVKERVARRDELQMRRTFFRGLTTIVKQAIAAAPSEGGGYLIVPHFWFINTVLWADPEKGDQPDEDTLRPLGPSFRKHLNPRARQYFHRVLRATQIDAIFLEDGVGHRKLEKVLRNLLELYDIHGGRRVAQEQHFQGLPEIRVVIHDYSPGNPFQMDDYPEPKFDDVSRSRVLHIFKDRGDSEETQDVPFDFSWEPSPMAIG